MANLTKSCKDKLNSVHICDLFPAEGSGMTKHAKCPKCGKQGKLKGKHVGLNIVDDQVRNRHFVKCNSCGFKAGGGAINVMMEMSDLKFMDACQKIADQTGIQLEFEQEKKKADSRQSQKDLEGSFCARQLEASGLTFDDVRATVIIDGNTCQTSPFKKGAIDPGTGKVDDLKDEMVIHYFDLEGRRRQFIPSRNKTRSMPYVRVRWSNPDAHKDKRGKAIKYQTPAGAKTELYIPQRIRSLFQTKTQFDTLFIQEGEKKAEKACKHGINSIAIQGIGNIGRKEEGLPDELQYLVQKCSIKNIVFLMDADWQDLKSELHDNDRVDGRPRDFARALIKFRKYVGTLAQCGIYVDIWFAHVNANDNGDKGIDDLLVNTLKDREEVLMPQILDSMIAHDGKGEFIDIINITSFTDSKIMDLWNLNSKDDFFDNHHERLVNLKSFRFGDVFWKVEDGAIKMATEFGTGKEFWSVSYDDKGKKKIDIDLLDMLSFLTANGFRSKKTEDGKRDFIKIERGVITPKDEFDIRNFVLSYVKKATKDHQIHLHFAESISTKLSVSNMCQLDLIQTTAGLPNRSAQQFFFKDAQISITDAMIETSQLIGPVWSDNLIKRSFQREQIFRKFEPNDKGSFDIQLTEAGEECEFLTYIFHTSDMKKGKPRSQKDEEEKAMHIANKITCLGFLLRDFKFLTETKAVIAMDAAMSEVGTSKGRTGKSIFGVAISHFINQAMLDGRNTSNDDQYIFSEVTRQTKSIFIDDINMNFDFGRFYQRITGKLNVNPKAQARFFIPYELAPKFIITTNHAISGLDDSAMARAIFISFSDWYNKDYTPIEEFGHSMFSDWDDRQWQLFDNLMAESVMLYMRSYEKGWAQPGCGAINPPMEDIRRRTLRQEMGEIFLSWAEIYFAPDGDHINTRIIRRNLYEAYLTEFGIKSTQLSAKSFRQKLIAFCEYTGMHLNAHRRDAKGLTFAQHFSLHPGRTFIGDRDLSASQEFYTISTTESLIRQELSTLP